MRRAVTMRTIASVPTAALALSVAACTAEGSHPDVEAVPQGLREPVTIPQPVKPPHAPTTRRLVERKRAARPELDDPVAPVHAAIVRYEWERARSLAEEGRRAAEPRGEGILAARFECARHKVDVARRDANVDRTALQGLMRRLEQTGAPKWAQAECVEVATAAAMIDYDFPAARRLGKRAYDLVWAEPHPSVEREATILINYAAILQTDPSQHEAAAEMMKQALALEIDAEIPACPEQADSRLRIAALIQMSPALDDSGIDGLLGRALDDCEAADAPIGIAHTELARASWAAHQSRWAPALESARRAWRIFEAKGVLHDKRVATSIELRALRESGERDAARALVEIRGRRQATGRVGSHGEPRGPAWRRAARHRAPRRPVLALRPRAIVGATRRRSLVRRRDVALVEDPTRSAPRPGAVGGRSRFGRRRLFSGPGANTGAG
jgi:hypothetical protein